MGEAAYAHPPMTPRRPRETLPDALRALAMVSVLTLNAIGYAFVPGGSALGARMPADSVLAAVVQGTVAALLQGKGLAMLAFVFGMSLWLAARTRDRAGALQRGLVRNRRLLGLGFLHGAFIYCGDILTLYALVGRGLLRRLHMPWQRFRRHLRWSLAAAILAKLVLVTATVMLPDRPADDGGATLSSVQGGWQFLKVNAGFYFVGQAVALIVAGPVMYLCMVCGVAAVRLRLLTHRRWRARLERQLWRWGPVLIALTLAYGVGAAVTTPGEAIQPWVEAFGDLLAVPVAAVYVAALALVSSGGRTGWCHGLGPLGRRTLTLYVGHSVICLLLFSGAGLALKPTTIQIVLFALSLWLLAFGATRLSGARRWPLEAWMGRG